MATSNRFTLRAHTVINRFRHFCRQVDLFDTYVDNFDTQRRHTVRVDHLHFTVGFGFHTLCRFSNRVVSRRGANLIFRTGRTRVQRIAHFQGQATTGVGDDIFHIQTTNFRTQTVREFTLQQHLGLGDVAAAGCQVVTAEVADTPLDIGVDDQVFLLFSNETVSLVVHGLNTRIQHLHRFDKRDLEVQAWRIHQRLIFVVAQNFTETQRDTALAFLYDKDRHVEHYQHDDNDRDNRFTHRYSP